MISESHSDWKRCPAPLVVVRELAVVHDGDVGEGICPVRMGVGDVDVGLGRHPRVADRVRPHERVELVVGRDRLGVAEVLDDLERAAEREHLGVAHVLDVVGELLEVAVEAEGDRHRVLRGGRID